MNDHEKSFVIYKALANLRTEIAKTYLSFSWWILEPLLSMSVFYIVFGLLIPRKIEHFVPFLLVGLISWQWFANTIKHCMNSISGNGRLMTQVYVPKIVFPSVVIVMDFIKFLLVFSLIVLFLFFYGMNIGICYISLPLVMGVQLMLIIAVALFVAAIIPFIPDLKFLIDSLLHLMFFLSGIFYSGSSIPEKFQYYFYLNPMANIIENYRNIMIDNRWPDLNSISVIGLVALIGLIVSQRLIYKFDYQYPRIVTT